MALSILLCFALALELPVMAEAAGPDAPKEFSSSLSFGGESPEEQIAEYVIALDSSASMRDTVAARNAAAAALIQNLPYEKTRAAAFFFSNTCENPLGILPMDQDEARQSLAASVERNTGVGGGTDLGLMMRTAIGLFSDKGTDPSVRHILFVITDGQSDGENGLAESRDQEFFTLCQDYQDTVRTHVVYVSDGAPPDSLCEGLRTEPITLEDSNPDTLAACAERLVSQNAGELAKVLSISDIDLLETALLLLCFSTGDGVSCHVVDQDTIVSFEIPPCAQTLTIALGGDVSVRETLGDLKLEGGQEDLLAGAEIGADSSVAVIHSDRGLPPGRYSMAVKTDTPLSIVLSYQYSFQIQYGLSGLDCPQAPPAGTQAALQMRLLAPDGTPLDSDGSLELSMNIYRRLGDGTFVWHASVEDGGMFSAADLGEAEQLRFCPVVSYSGKRIELEQGWDVQLSEAILEPGPVQSPEPSPSAGLNPVPDPPPDSPKAVKSFVLAAASGLFTAVAVLSAAAVLYVWLQRRVRKDGKGWLDGGATESKIVLTDDPIRAGIRWQAEGLKNGNKVYLLGGVGLTDDSGRPRSGCDLSGLRVWGVDGLISLTPKENPLGFCRWRYSPQKKCTELILHQDPEIKEGGGAKITFTGSLLTEECGSPSGGVYRFFGVDQAHRYGEVTVNTGEWTVCFQLEHYIDWEPFIFEGGSADA